MGLISVIFLYRLLLFNINKKHSYRSSHGPLVGELIGRASDEKAGLVYSDMFSFGRSCKDANEAVTFGLFKLDPSTDNIPSGINYGDVLLVLPWDQNTVHQFIFTVGGQEYKRIKSVTWGEWNLR